MPSSFHATDNHQRETLPDNSRIASPSDRSVARPQPRQIPLLEPAQQDLLVAALNSQFQPGLSAPLTDNVTTPSYPVSSVRQSHTMSDSTLFQSPDLGNVNGDFTPDLYDFDGDNSFDFDNADLGGEMIGALPDGAAGPEHHEKRKSPDEDDAAEEGDSKRQETQDGEKGAKKPGRKPLTSEPTTKRKAQNRAAQRAFRERKEQHLKDLETKVSELAKAKEADQHENGLLRAKVDRLQSELKDYRKRLSLNGNGASRSPPLAPSYGAPNKNPASSNFQFEFPKFGSLPTNGILSNSPKDFAGNNVVTPPAISQSSDAGSFSSQSAQQSRHNSGSPGLSPQNQYSGAGSPSQAITTNPGLADMTFAPYSTNDNMHGFASTLPQMGNDPFGDLFSPSILKSAAQTGNTGYFAPPQKLDSKALVNVGNGGDSTAGIPDHRVFRFNSASVASDSASPSASSLSQWNNGTANSSCGTSPEPSHDSPANKDKPADSFADRTVTPTQFINPSQPSAQSISNQLSFGNLNGNNFQVPNAGTFDPVLFGDYRDSNDHIVGGGDFSGGFFDDAMNSNPLDLGSPSNLFGILSDFSSNTQPPSDAPTPSRNLMAEIEKARDGGDDDYGLAAAQLPKKMDSNGQLISCTKLWNELQSNPAFQDGKFDLDGLCSELRTKARCSESGLLVDKDHVDAALKKMGARAPADAPQSSESAHLLFEQDTWDNYLKKMGSA